MDLSKITDLEKLESMAFKTIESIDVGQANLKIIQERIRQVRAQPTQNTKEEKPNGKQETNQDKA